MRRILRPAILIVAAMAGSGLMLVALILMAKNLTVYSGKPADFLPAEAVRLLLHNPTAQDLDFWKDRSDTMRKVGANSPAAVALIQQNNTQDAVAFLTEKDTTHSVGRYGLETHNPKVVPLITAQSDALGKESSYRNLQTAIPAQTPWVYVRKQKSNVPRNRILQSLLLSAQDAFGYTYTPSTLTLFSAKDQKPGLLHAPVHIPHLNNRIAAVSIANANATWNSWQDAMATNDRVTTEGFFRSAVSFLGPDMSFEYDILPLLSNPSVIQMAQTGGSLHLLVSGSMSDEELLNETIERMHTSFEKTLPTTKVTRRVLDQRFTTTDLRHNQDSIQQTYEPQGDWYIISTKREDRTTGLFTAISGTQFHIARRRDVLENALSKTDTLQSMEDFERLNRTAIGMFEPKALADALGTKLPEWKTLLTVMGEKTVYFGSFWRPNVQTWVLQNHENSVNLLDSLL